VPAAKTIASRNDPRTWIYCDCYGHQLWTSYVTYLSGQRLTVTDFEPSSSDGQVGALNPAAGALSCPAKRWDGSALVTCGCSTFRVAGASVAAGTALTQAGSNLTIG
jgi:hypothetical protein